MKYIKILLIFCLFYPTFAVEVHGHRGARAKRPENTLAAFRHALQVGTYVLEMDLLVSKDGVLVVHHDFRINLGLCRQIGAANFSKSGSEGPAIIDLNVDEIRSFDCGSIKNPSFPEQVLSPGEVIPTFDEVVELIKAESPNPSQVKWNLEMKSKKSQPSFSPKPKLFAQLLLQSISRHNIKPNVILQSFDYRTLEAARKIDPTIKISALAGNKSPSLYRTMKNLKPDYISPKGSLVTPRLIKTAHSRAIKVVPWTINSSQDWNTMLHLDVDGIITDDPEGLLKFLKTLSP